MTALGYFEGERNVAITIINRKVYSYYNSILPSTTLSRRINFIDVFSDPSYISRIDINMTADNYCSIKLDGNWYLNMFFNVTDNLGAPQCGSISRTIVDKTYNKDSYITLYATDDGRKTTSLWYSVTFTITSK